MPRLFECVKYIQSEEKGASQAMRDSCLRCGRTKAAHEADIVIPSDQLAVEWLEQSGYGGQSYFELVRGILARYIGEHR